MFSSEDPLQRGGALAIVVVRRLAVVATRTVHYTLPRLAGYGVSGALALAVVGMPPHADADTADALAGGLTPDVCAALRAADPSVPVAGADLAGTVCGMERRDTAHAADHIAAALQSYLAGHPMAAMADALADQDPVVAAYMVAMAKQESNWGKHVPTLAGADCYNYWGFRAQRARMGTGGHTCFDSPEDAVATVGARVEELVHGQGRTTARSLLIWKCGASCATHDPAGVARWVSVVDTYYAAAAGVIADAGRLPQRNADVAAGKDKRLSLAR